MKKDILITIFCLIFSCIVCTGCTERPNISESIKELSQEEKKITENAKTVYDIASLLTRTADYPKYSECAQDDEYNWYFDLLIGKKEYFTVSQNNEKYVLFCYEFSDYGVVMDSIESISKNYSSGSLKIKINKNLSQTGNEGCEPNLSYARCIVKLNEDITSLIIDGTDYTPYTGGYIHAGDLWGVADEDLNIIVPVQYGIIRNLETYGTDKQYYYMAGDQGMGLMDENYETIFSPKYSGIIFLNDDRFVVGKIPENSTGLSKAQFGIIDRNENLIHEYIDGFIGDGFHNGVHQSVFTRVKGENYCKGVIDDELNVIIEPDYKNISVFGIGNAGDQFYVVENDNEEFAVIDSSGEQQTGFEKTSVYDVQTKYYQYLRDS